MRQRGEIHASKQPIVRPSHQSISSIHHLIHHLISAMCSTSTSVQLDTILADIYKPEFPKKFATTILGRARSRYSTLVRLKASFDMGNTISLRPKGQSELRWADMDVFGCSKQDFDEEYGGWKSHPKLQEEDRIYFRLISRDKNFVRNNAPKKNLVKSYFVSSRDPLLDAAASMGLCAIARFLDVGIPFTVSDSISPEVWEEVRVLPPNARGNVCTPRQIGNGYGGIFAKLGVAAQDNPMLARYIYIQIHTHHHTSYFCEF